MQEASNEPAIPYGLPGGGEPSAQASQYWPDSEREYLERLTGSVPAHKKQHFEDLMKAYVDPNSGVSPRGMRDMISVYLEEERPSDAQTVSQPASKQAKSQGSGLGEPSVPGQSSRPDSAPTFNMMGGSGRAPPPESESLRVRDPSGVRFYLYLGTGEMPDYSSATDTELEENSHLQKWWPSGEPRLL